MNVAVAVRVNESVTCSVTFVVPATIGLPVMTPSGLRSKPAGSGLPMLSHVKVGTPVPGSTVRLRFTFSVAIDLWGPGL